MVPAYTLHGTEQHQRRATLGLFETLMLDHGTRIRSHGADLVNLDKAARQRISREVGGMRGMRVFDRYCGNSYIIAADDGRVITAEHRRRRVKRP